MLNFLRYLAEAFIAAFGITRPAPRQARLVTLLLGGFLLTAGLGALGGLGLLLWQVYLGRR